MIVAIDGRMREGVGALIQHVTLGIARSVDKVVIFGDPASISSWGSLPTNIEIVPFLASIYGWREQVEYPVSRLKGCSILHVPHFNIPIRPVPCPLIASIHDTAHLAGVLPMSLAYKAAARMYYVHATRRASHILTGSEFSKSEIISRLGLPPEKITVVPDGVDSRKFSRLDPKKAEPILARLGIQKPFLLILGSIRPHKNVALALRAFELLKIRERIPHRLVIVGRKEGFRINRDLPRLTGDVERDVIFTGFLEDEEIIALYSTAELFLFPSLYEGFGLPPLEAMACGTPVVVSLAGAIPEVVGDAGVYVNPNDPEEFAGAVKSLLNDPGRCAQLSRLGRERAKTFTWERTIEGHLAAYQSYSR